MKARLVWASVAVLFVISTLLSTVPAGLAQNTVFTYELKNHVDGTLSYSLNVGVSPALNDYYAGLSHRSYTDNDFQKFITPYSVRPIADVLREIYPDDEDFTNAVLSIIHQIPYEETVEQFYPVETLLRHKGDCDMFSLLAASIIKAGGLDVTLLHYVSDEHMNIGVHLAQDPTDARQDVYSVKMDNVTYYIAECTGTNWRVGECPPDLQETSPIVVPLNNYEQIAPGQVSASFKNLTTTTMTLSVSSAFVLEGSFVNIEGKLSSALFNENVTIYASASGSDWTVLATTKTRAEGKFSYQWRSVGIGEVMIRSGWAGNDQFAGTTSSSTKTLILPFYLVALFVIAVAAVALCVVVFAVKRKSSKPQSPELQFVTEN